MAKGLQTNVGIYPPEGQWLERQGQGRAAQLRDDLAVLQGLARPPHLSEAEENLLRDILNSTMLDPRQLRHWPMLLAADMEDSAPEGLGDKWGLGLVDLADLAGRLKALHPADAWALVDSVRRWWAEQK